MPEFMPYVGIVVGAIASYFGALNAIREDLARTKARADEALKDAGEAFTHAQRAHDRIDTVMHRK